MAFAKVLLAEDTNGYDSAVRTATEKMQLVQQAVDAYTALGIATVPVTADLQDLWYNPKLFLERMLTGGQPVTLNAGGGTLPVEPGRVYDLLKKPAGTDAFLLKIAALKDARNGGWTGAVSPEGCELVGGQVKMTQASLNQLRESYRIYATNQRQKDEWDQLQIVTTALETIRQTGGFGERFDAVDYLEKALGRKGYKFFDDLNPVRPDAKYIVTTERLSQ